MPDALACASADAASFPVRPCRTSTARPVTEVDFSRPCIMAVGNEGNGLTAEAMQPRPAICASQFPCSGRAESLNAASSAAILMWEMMRSVTAEDFRRWITESYWIWMQHALRAGQHQSRAGFSAIRFRPSAFYESGRESWLLDGMFTQRELEHLSSFSLDQAQAQLETCACESWASRFYCPDRSGLSHFASGDILSRPASSMYKGELPACRRTCCHCNGGHAQCDFTGMASLRSNLLSYGLAEQRRRSGERRCCGH